MQKLQLKMQPRLSQKQHALSAAFEDAAR